MYFLECYSELEYFDGQKKEKRHETMKISLKSFAQIVLAGICTGMFFAVRSFSAIRLSPHIETESSLLWAFAPLSEIGLYVGIAIILLVGCWLLYSSIYARWYGISFSRVLALDAATYLPLCALTISVAQFNTFLTHHFEAFLLLGQDFGYFVLVCTLIGVYHLKKSNHQQLQRIVVQKNIIPYCANSQLTWQRILTIFLISLFIYLLVGLRITHKLPLGGDEPHYLLMTHSLLHDHDLAISNNYQQKDYQPFYPGELKPHLSIGKDKTRYSIHPIGLPFLLVPGYALYGRQGAVWVMNVLAAFLAIVLYLLAWSLTGHQWLSLLIWAVTSFTTPILLYSSQLYPEIPSALLLGTVYYLIRFRPLKRVFSAIFLGGSFAFLPWLQQRMILPTCLLALYYLFLAGIVPGQKEWKRRFTGLRILPLIFLAVSGILMAGYYYQIYGNPFPNAPYLSIGRKHVFSSTIFIREGLLGLLLDQEAGLFIFSPYYLFAIPGFLLFLQRAWRHALVWLALILSIYIPCAGFVMQWRGAWSPAARYLVALIPLFLVPFSMMLPVLQRNIFRYALFFLMTISFSWSYLFLKIPCLSLMSRDGINMVFEQYSRLVDLTKYFPSFTPTATNNTALAGFWLTTILLFSGWVYASTCLPSRSGALRSRQSLQQVLLVFGVMLGFLLALSRIAAHTQNKALTYISHNKQIQGFLRHLDNDVLALQSRQAQLRLSSEQLRLEYMREPRTAIASQQGSRFLITGPREPFSQGKYTVYFTLIVGVCTPDQPVATLDISAHHGQQIFFQKELYGKDFPAPRQEVRIPVTFELPFNVLDLETRVYFHNQVNLTLTNIAIEPQLEDFYYRAGLLALYKGQYEKARHLFSCATSISDHALSWYQLGLLEQRVKNWEQSLKILQQVIEQDPTFADAYYRVGLAFEQLGQSEQAQQAFSQATRLQSRHLDAWQARLNLLPPDHQAEIQEIRQTINALYRPQYSASVNFGNQIMFLGYTIQQPKPGTLHLEYYWKAISPMKTDYIVFVHFENAHTRFQQDHTPQVRDASTGQERLYPTSSWQVGELVHEEFEFSVPPGVFTLRLGIWDPHGTKKHLPIINSDSQYDIEKRYKLVLEPIEIY
ncbi:hypothetical protein U27_05710 [Candidatus Vecturithrix granuli]|uniref:Tetratricopeptide repeat protein n=1 Tax=Vecturithrix granuli TaxID=1499967 RepID=A0A081C2D0_VECG1|nr:hypothetical protein U27_05710 [Candidatus Vecturithrix granuli]